MIDGALESVPAIASSRRPVEPDLSGVHVLIVEDDPDGNELMCAILERYGARVTSTSTAGDALRVLEGGERPSVVVSDIGLPDMDGMDMIRTVRETMGLVMLPAIALTAYASHRDALHALAAGFDAHVSKPIQPEALGAAVVRLIVAKRSGNAP